MRCGSLRRLVLCTGALGVTQPAHAIDAFEIQVYDGTANPARAPGLELHVDHVLWGATTATPPELPADHRTTFTLEPSFGVFDFWELGAYFQTALRADGEFDYAGVKLRSKFVTPPGWHDRLRLGANFEFSILPRAYDRDRYGGEVRPIVAWEDEHWLFAANPILDFSFASRDFGQGPEFEFSILPRAYDRDRYGGEVRPIVAWEDEHWLFAANPILDFSFASRDFGQGPEFEPCLMAKRKLGPIALGLEYYAGLGPIGHPLPWSDEDEYVYETFDLISLPRVEVNFGVGEGLSAASSDLVAKLNLGYVWDPLIGR